MKKFTGFMKYIISGTGVTFMVTTLFLWGAATLLSGADGINDISFRSETFAAIFVFALLTALISLVLKAKFISPEILRVCLHFILSLGSFILFIYMAGVTSRGSGVLALTAAVGFCYIIVAAVIFAERAVKRKSREKSRNMNRSMAVKKKIRDEKDRAEAHDALPPDLSI